MVAQNFHFEYPLLLLALAIPFLLWWLPRTQLKEDNFEKLKPYADSHLLPYLITQNSLQQVTTKKAFINWAMLWVLSIIAMAGPRWDYHDVRVFKPATSLVILLDISKSMDSDDVRPSRLIRAKQEIEDFVSLAKQTNIGLIAFASIAHIVTPITEDHNTLIHLLPSLSTQLVKFKGSRIVNAISQTKKLLQSQPKENPKAILLITDGDFNENQLEKTIQSLQKENIRLYIMGIGTKDGSLIPGHNNNWMTDQSGKKIISQLNEAELENLATLGKGVYTTANYRDNDTHILLDAIEKNMPTNTIEKNPVRVWHERFYIPLFFIIPLLLYRFKQNSV